MVKFMPRAILFITYGHQINYELFCIITYGHHHKVAVNFRRLSLLVRFFFTKKGAKKVAKKWHKKWYNSGP